MTPKFQIFISSTYRDLIEERQEIIKTILELGHIPVGMEHFPAGNEDQWTTIKGLLDDCDYYIVVLGGMYGTVEKNTGKSYTQLEYEYAIEKKIPIIGFVHKNPSLLPAIKQETDQLQIEKLANFSKMVKKKICKFWQTPSDLSKHAAISLLKLMEKHPRPGWIRRVLSQSNDLQPQLMLQPKQAVVARSLSECTPTRLDIERAFDLSIKEFTSFLELYFIIEGLYSHSNTEDRLPNANLVPIQQNNIASHHHQISELWQRCYKTIHRLIRISEICEEDPSQIKFGPVSRLHISYIYFCMTTLWGDVPYIDAPIEISESTNISRTDIIEITKLSINSLASIVDNVQIGTYKFFATAVLAKWELSSKNYHAALSHLKLLIDTETYQLAPKDLIFGTDKECIVFFDIEKEPSLFKGEDFLKLCKKGRFVSYMRYTEILLMASEASFGLKNTRDAADYLNMVRQRNGKSLIKESDPELLIALLTEWKEDLGMEGSYFAALKRNGLAEKTLNIVSDRLVLPIPMKELMLSPDLIQNSGY